MLSAVIALSPTAAEIFEEDELMRRITRARQDRPVAGPSEPGSLFRPRQSSRRGGDQPFN